jgi:hypothetical protein
MTTILLNLMHHADVVLAIIVIAAIGVYAVSATIYAFSFTSKKA